MNQMVLVTTHLIITSVTKFTHTNIICSERKKHKIKLMKKMGNTKYELVFDTYSDESSSVLDIYVYIYKIAARPKCISIHLTDFTQSMSNPLG